MSSHLFAGTIYDQEYTLELDSLQRGARRYQDMVAQATNRNEGGCLKAAERMEAHWFAALSRAIASEKAQVTLKKNGVGRGVYGPYLPALSSSKWAVITMNAVMSKCLSEETWFGPTNMSLTSAIGRAAHAESRIALIRGDKEAWNTLVHTDRCKLHVEHVNQIANQHWPETTWPLRVQIHLGACLLRLLVKVARCNSWHDEKPVKAFEQKIEYRKARTIKHTRLTDEAAEILAAGHNFRKKLFPAYQPMIVPPGTWSADCRGGYLKLPSSPVKKAVRAGKVEIPERVYDCLNAVNATPWRVNKRVLNVAIALWDDGGNIAGMPRRYGQPKPPRPADFDTNPEAKKDWKKQAAMTYRSNMQTAGMATSMEGVLDVAYRFQDTASFWLPHQLDFTTRAYPMPLYLNQQGDDICRGLLEFADAREVTPRGRWWLKVHMANCCDLDKMPFDSRVSWVEDSMDAISGWADSPLQNTGWMEYDDPFQVLAAAIALGNDDAGAHLPVALDGVNNALQHYAAMLRDQSLAEMVCLTPTPAPYDLYSNVADITIKSVEQAAELGDPNAARLLGWVKRSIIKQPSMTKFYNVTPVGAARQVRKHLTKAGFEYEEWEHFRRSSKLLAKATDEAMVSLCPRAQLAMDWMAAVAEKIAKAGFPLRWRTPLGFLCEQPYRSARKLKIKTILHQLTINERSNDCPVAVKRQVQGFAPNFVHSLDASHMLLTAKASYDSGLDFAGVHDSFGSHAADIDVLRPIIREKFLEVHKTPAMDDLAVQLDEMHPEIELPEMPTPGDFDIETVRDSEYIFS